MNSHLFSMSALMISLLSVSGCQSSTTNLTSNATSTSSSSHNNVQSRKHFAFIMGDEFKRYRTPPDVRFDFSQITVTATGTENTTLHLQSPQFSEETSKMMSKTMFRENSATMRKVQEYGFSLVFLTNGASSWTITVPKSEVQE